MAQSEPSIAIRNDSDLNGSSDEAEDDIETNPAVGLVAAEDIHVKDEEEFDSNTPSRINWQEIGKKKLSVWRNLPAKSAILFSLHVKI